MKISIARFFLIATALIIGSLAVKYSLANLNYLKVDNYLTRWKQHNTLTDEELADALQASDTMLALHGHHPHYLNMAAKVYEWQAYQLRDDISLAQESLHHAFALYQKSSELRAHWPLTWVYMAQIKSQLGIYDHDFYRYIDNAIVYGPYMQEVNLQVAELYLVAGDNMPEFSKKVAFEQIKRALIGSKTRYSLLNYAQSLGKQKLVCTIGKLNQLAWVSQQRLCK